MELELHDDWLSFKALERHCGFLVYISHTYPAFVPYLSGTYLTLESWRPSRKENGWKMSMWEIRAAMVDYEQGDDGGMMGRWMP